jgi:WhiB family redox-sensing transcriptional regulator
MNGNEQPYADLAAELDELEQVPYDALAHTLAWHGTCMWLRATDEEPRWTHDATHDRQMVAPICAACPVQRECLELEFRRSWGDSTSVWGPLPADERRDAFMAWSERRSEGGERA